jgi:very-short-patch-repair endonuclease
MEGKYEAGWIDRAIAGLAARQHGLVARWQLLALGISGGAVEMRLAHGRLHRAHRGVYALSPAELSPQARWMAGVLAGGHDAALSHWSAAALWRLRPGVGPKCHVTTPRRRRSNHKLTFHESRLLPDEVTIEQGIRVTVPTRVALDLAPLLPSHILVRIIEAIEASQLWVGPSLPELFERYRRRSGVAKLKAAAATPIRMTRSDLEAIVLEAIERGGLPRPQVNVVVEGHEVDFVWRDEGVVAELDTYLTHGSPLAFERDRERDRKLAAAGWRVVRLTDQRTDEGIADLSRLLAASAARSPAAA